MSPWHLGAKHFQCCLSYPKVWAINLIFLAHWQCPFYEPLEKTGKKKHFYYFQLFFNLFLHSLNSSLHKKSLQFSNMSIWFVNTVLTSAGCLIIMIKETNKKNPNNIPQSSRYHLLINLFLSLEDEMPFLGCCTTLNIKAVSFSVPEVLLISHQAKS